MCTDDSVTSLMLGIFGRIISKFVVVEKELGSLCVPLDPAVAVGYPEIIFVGSIERYSAVIVVSSAPVL